MFSDEERDRAHRRAEAAYIGVAKWDDAVRADCDAAGATANLHRVADVMLGLTSELLAARDEKSLAGQEVAELRLRAGPQATARVLARLASQGARVAVLEEELAAVRPWKASMDMQGKIIREQEQHISDLEQSLEHARDELTDALSRERSGKALVSAAIVDVKNARAERDDAISRAESRVLQINVLSAERDSWRQCAEERQQAAQQQANDKAAIAKERDEALADNAALLDALRDAIVSLSWAGTHFQDGTDNRTHWESDLARALRNRDRPHPGAALLERAKRLEARATSLGVVVEQIALENVSNPYAFARESLEKLVH